MSQDATIRAILRDCRTVAIVGASAKPERPSHDVMRYLLERGYRCVPVNPGQAGKAIAGQMTFATLSAIPFPIDLVDIFRRSEDVGPVVDAALALQPRPKAIWMQMGIRDDEAARRAETAGLRVVVDRCPKIEIPRLLGRDFRRS